MHFSIGAPDATLAARLQAKLDSKTKPPGSLGRLEELALQIGLVQHSLSPRLVKPHILVCAGDHGALGEPEGACLSAFPQEVTWQMVENFLAGGAAISVLARQAGIVLKVADAGVNHDFGRREGLIDAKIGFGTRSYLRGAAMSESECELAIQRGAAIAASLGGEGCNVLGFGEMGIGNTASAALLTHFFTSAPMEECVGRGTGLDDGGLRRKRELLAEVASRYEGPRSALSLLAHFGGFEIAMLVGAMLAAAQQRMLLLIDGFIVTAALLVAAKLHPAVLPYCVFSHCSQERGHALQLELFGAEPLLDLELRLGEGTGAALAYPIAAAAVAILNDMASFESARVSGKRGVS
jgi:nicotinate-nucleotide--dimethylbenzimidazole phosphoribosyltransferase